MALPNAADVNEAATAANSVTGVKSAQQTWRAQMEAGVRRDWDAVMTHFAADCVWFLVTSRRTFSGPIEIREFLESGFTASERDEPEIRTDFASGDWGVFEYTSRGTINKGVSRFDASLSIAGVARKSHSLKRTVEPLAGFFKRIVMRALVGRRFEVPVCFIYHVNGSGLIDRVNEYVGPFRLVWR